MSGEGRRNKSRKIKSHVTQKKLGRVAQLAIRHNDEEAEAFLADMEAGRPTRMQLGEVVGVFGGGSFLVQVGPSQIKAHLRGIIRGRGGFHRNPEAVTAARLHSHVVVDGEEIWAVLTPGQAYRAQKALGPRSNRSNRSNLFNRSSERRRNTIRRTALLKSLDTRKNKKTSSSFW